MFNSIKTLRFEGDISEIGSEAFCQCKNLQEVYFPKKIGRIGVDAFSRCPALTKVDFYEVDKIDLGAFERNTLAGRGQKVEPTNDGLREVIFHNRVGTLSGDAFAYNTMLETITGMENVESIEGDPFAGTPFENKFTALERGKK